MKAFARRLKAGKRSVGFSGILASRTFKPGDYRVSARATTPDGDRSARVSALFTIADAD